MDEQHPRFVVESRLARRRLAQAFESTIDWETKHRFSPLGGRTFAMSRQKHDGRGEKPVGALVRLITSFVYRTLVKQLGKAKRDISGIGFFLVLTHLCENAADNPVFWRLVGATPLALL
jgi:hypothetical protein